jgi:hypothetical protein
VGSTLRVNSNIIQCAGYLWSIYHPAVSAVSVESDLTNGDGGSSIIKRVHLIMRSLFLNLTFS